MSKKSSIVLIPTMLLLSLLFMLAQAQASTSLRTSSTTDSGQSAYLPIIYMPGDPPPSENGGYDAPNNGRCPEGFYLASVGDEQSGMSAPDSTDYTDNSYICLPEETAADATCSVFGEATVSNGRAVCACPEGYAGDQCQLCAPGYQWDDGRAQCTQIEPTRVLSSTIPDIDIPVIFGGSTLIEGAGGSGRYNWSIGEGDDGCLKADLRDACSQTINNVADVYFVAPDSGGDLSLTEVVATDASDSNLENKLGIVYVNPDTIPVTGNGNVHLKPLLEAITDFMHYRCVGAGTIGVSYYGKPIAVWGLGRMDGRAEINSLASCGDDTENPYEAGSTVVTPDTPFRLGSVSKGVAFAIGREATRQEWNNAFGEFPSQDEIEELKLIGSLLQLPAPLSSYYSGNQDVPVIIDVDGTKADIDWLDVTLGHLLSHRSGLPRSAPKTLTDTLPALRGFSPTNLTALGNQQAALESEFGAANVTNGRNAIAAATGTNANNVYMLPAMTLNEVLTMIAGRKLVTDPLDREYQYSNTSPGYVTIMAEEMTGIPFAAATGDPNSHENTLLDQFFSARVGVETTGQSGIFNSQEVWPLPAGDPETRQRNWSVADQTYYPLSLDDKRPFCLWTGSTCSFNSWIQATNGRPNWDWAMQKVPHYLTSTGISPGTGSLAADAETFLRFMSKYWVGGYDENPRIGEERTNKNDNIIWNSIETHNGARSGAFTWAIQFGSNGGTMLHLPPRDTDDLELQNASPERSVEFFAGAVNNGQIVSYNADGFSTNAFFHTPMDMTVGNFDLSGQVHIYIATISEDIHVYTPNGTKVGDFDVEFQEGNQLVVENVDDDIFDEMIIYKHDEGRIKVYDHDGTYLFSRGSNLSDVQIGVGAYTSGAMKEYIYVIHPSGELEVYNPRVNSSSSLGTLDYESGDGFAVGNVLGSSRYLDEIVIGKKDSGIIDIYTYSKDDDEYVLQRSFDGYFEENGAIEIADLNLIREELMVAQTSTGQVRVFKMGYDTENKEETYFEHKLTLQAGPNNDEDLYEPGVFLAAGNLGVGKTGQFCSLPNGNIQRLPNGVDVFVSINQWDNDRSCSVDSGYECKDAYGLLYDIIKHGVCQVDWSKVTNFDIVDP